MNAIAEIIPLRRDLSEVIPGRERSWIDAVLNQWGEWQWKRRHFEGYKTCDSVQGFLNGAGGGDFGHRILCLDPPRWFLLTHALYLMLPDHEKVAVFAEYVPGVGDDGRCWSREQKCLALGISDEGYRKRLQRARYRIWRWSMERSHRRN